jgi:hypothetical protein
MNDTTSTPSDAVSPPYNAEDEERRWWREMYGRMSRYNRAHRDGEGPALSALDIEVRCYEIVSPLSYARSRRTWSKVLPDCPSRRVEFDRPARSAQDHEGSREETARRCRPG